MFFLSTLSKAPITKYITSKVKYQNLILLALSILKHPYLLSKKNLSNVKCKRKSSRVYFLLFLFSYHNNIITLHISSSRILVWVCKIILALGKYERKIEIWKRLSDAQIWVNFSLRNSIWFWKGEFDFRPKVVSSLMVLVFRLCLCASDYKNIYKGFTMKLSYAASRINIEATVSLPFFKFVDNIWAKHKIEIENMLKDHAVKSIVEKLISQ